MAEPVTEEDSWAFRPASTTKKKNKKKSLKNHWYDEPIPEPEPEPVIGDEEITEVEARSHSPK